MGEPFPAPLRQDIPFALYCRHHERRKEAHDDGRRQDAGHSEGATNASVSSHKNYAAVRKTAATGASGNNLRTRAARCDAVSPFGPTGALSESRSRTMLKRRLDPLIEIGFLRLLDLIFLVRRQIR